MERNLHIFHYCFSIFIFFTRINLFLAADTITPEGSLQDGDTLVSSAQRFELGFFYPGKSKNRYLGIWYKQSPETVVWVANRNNPILDTNGSLVISDDGNLVLLNKSKGTVWSSNISSKLENPVAQLLDNGNFIVKDNFSSNASESYLWQSFDFPTDILLPEMKLGWNLKAGFDRYLTAWRSADDPSLGDYTFKLEIDLLPEMVIYNRSEKFARTGPWNGAFFGGIPTKPNLLFEPIVVTNQDEYTYRYESFNNPIVMLLKVNNSGMIQWQIWNERSTGWDSVYFAPEDVCGHYGHCGPNSVCNIDETPICECLKGFVPNSQSNHTSFNGCVRGSPLDCKGGDGFIKLDGIKLADLIDVSLNESMSLVECKAKCLNNCSCQAYINSNVTGGGSGCLVWFGDLVDIRKLVENRGTQDIFIRVPASELGTNSSSGTSTENENKGSSKHIWIIVIPILSLAMVIVGIMIPYMRRNIRSKGEDLLSFDVGMGLDDDHAELTEVKKLGESSSRKDVKLPLFSFASVSAATDNFSFTNMLGEGGFGPVYKGKLLKGDQIAVKRLSKRSGQGWEELKNEAVLIAKLQHKNLVRLLGCCIEQDEKILIYEYMPNKSLDIFLFDPEKRKLLDWTTRVRIIEGIAQGLLYLHEYSRLRIIHRDLKASNILLDKDMNPKISDFGMARIFGVDELQANTQRIVGTYGYMSPEYALEGVFSIKSDVFSFGVLLLEIISGKKNSGFYQADCLNLLGFAWDKWTSDGGLDLMDPVLEEAASRHILLRYVNIGLLCVQENAENRPSMSDVVSMLMNETATLSSPKQPAFAHIRSNADSKLSPDGGRPENCSINDITVTIMEARYIFIFFTIINLFLAADTITPEGSIQDGDTLVSSAQRFELGFFSPGKSKNRYLGIWYKQSPETVVWVANRNNPILDTNGSLVISDDGNLVLLNKSKGTVWSSNISSKLENPVAQLLDNGNFIVKDNFSSNASESYLWQSFDFPTDILLPEMKLGWNLKAGFDRYLTAWRSADDPSLGDYTFKLEIDLLPEMVIYNRSEKFARTGPWNGAFFGGIPTKPNLLFEPIVVTNQDEYTYRYESFNNPIVMLLKVNNSGMIQWQIWNERSTGWDSVYFAPEDVCGHYGHCGPNSVCNIDETPICECLKGFVPNSQSNHTSFNGCVRGSPLDCKGGDGFIKLDGIKLADLIDVSLNESMSLVECKAKCLNNCSCQAYINSNVTGGGSGCLVWFGDLVDIRKLVENRGTQDIFIRVPASELGTNSSSGTSTENENKGSSKHIWIIVIPILSLAMVIVGIMIPYMRRNIRSKGEDLLSFDVGMGLDDDHAELTEVKKLGESSSRKDVKLPLFSFASVSAATDNFSFTNMLGEGGFGPVYKGKLLKGDQIAVKRLSKRSGQGWEELKNEAVLIAKLQHKNLVRLLGCCIEQDEKILIYEYMPNKSLDIFLFDPEKRKLLDWTTRVRIIEGIAQGLLYLHEYSRLRIIHRDLKASNILLDKDMNPKISDFGMARIFGVDELQANTQRIVGTYGYMSPEYALEGVFSIKSDVFSFGVLLLEIISGKKNSGFYQADCLNLLGFAWDKWTSDGGLDLMDPVLEEAASRHILLRYVNIGLLCVQENAENRPSMSDVVSMLMNETATLSSPKQPAFAHIRSNADSKLSPDGGRPENCSINDITVTIMEAR
ncbi:uncharacterized protein LOC116138469 [Pistacia vera]|uniref:uncharacterized protein LOC116138469 n=1 Tax=Pistacia vera TaxID=55513 RepID=UPI00126377C6|nr:uncharacterized protein LOC116138469 [Pistacia vera]